MGVGSNLPGRHMRKVTPEQFVFEIPLYEALYYKNDNEDDIDDGSDEGEKMMQGIICFDGKMDGPCIYCGKSTTYKRKGSAPPSYDISSILRFTRTLALTLCCSRNEEHEIEVIFKVFPSEKGFMKIGQFPSIASLTKDEIKKYRKILGDKFDEFSRGVGLISHGVGIGSFVYVRRIFESLIEEAHVTAQKSADWDEKKYKQSRMDEKIDLLEPLLPSFLIKNKSLYGILGKGIHELSEQECLEIFPVVKLGIELILDEKIKHKEQEDKETQGTKLISKITGKLKGDKEQ